MQLHGGAWTAVVMPLFVLAVVVTLRLRSMRKERLLKVETLWVLPTIYLVLVGSILYAAVPSPLGWALLVAGVALGAVLGWHRGKFIRIHRDALTGELRQRASPVAMLLLLAIVILKLGARMVFGEAGPGQPGSSGMLLTDAFVGFASGLLFATRIEIYLRGRKILENG